MAQRIPEVQTEIRTLDREIEQSASYISSIPNDAKLQRSQLRETENIRNLYQTENFVLDKTNTSILTRSNRQEEFRIKFYQKNPELLNYLPAHEQLSLNQVTLNQLTNQYLGNLNHYDMSSIPKIPLGPIQEKAATVQMKNDQLLNMREEFQNLYELERLEGE